MYELIAPPIILGSSLIGVLTFSFLVASLVYLNSKKSTIQRSDARKKQDHQAIVQLSLIVIVFFVGYTPITGKKTKDFIYYFINFIKNF